MIEGIRAFLALVLTVTAGGAMGQEVPPPKAGAVRFATFNAALSDNAPGAVLTRLEAGTDAKARLVAEVIQRIRPDVLVLQELDRDEAGDALARFQDLYLAVGQGGAEPIAYPHTLFPPSNTGVPSGVDLDGDGVADGPADALGFGHHPGQYAFALLSRFPIGPVRTFRNLLWRDMPGNVMPPGHYSAAAEAVLPLSSKTHLLAGVETPFGRVTVLAAHPTPPVFDDPAVDWNGRRNFDEIRLLADLLRADSAAYARDDAGVAGGLAADSLAAGGLVAVAMAVVAGDLNADPERGDSRPGAILQLLEHPDVAAVAPMGSRGTATADFSSGLRVDYVLPTTALRVTRSGVFWPAAGTALAHLNAASDHRMVWVDVVPARPSADVDGEDGGVEGDEP